MIDVPGGPEFADGVTELCIVESIKILLSVVWFEGDETVDSQGPALLLGGEGLTPFSDEVGASEGLLSFKDDEAAALLAFDPVGEAAFVFVEDGEAPEVDALTLVLVVPT